MDKQIKVFIVEDEIPAQILLEKWIRAYGGMQLEGVYSDGFSALKAIQQEKPDLVFLDIEIPKLTGLELLELIDEPPSIIFTTAYQEYAVKAFELSAIDYLLKPFSFERFTQAVDKVISLEENPILKMRKLPNEWRNFQKNVHKKERIVVKDVAEIHVIPIYEIMWLEAQDDYVKIHTKKRNYLKLGSLQSIYEELPQDDFIQVHRSNILNISAISKIENYSKDSYRAILSDGKNVKISRSGLQLLRKILYL